MSNNLKLIDKTDNFGFIDIEKQSGFARKEPTVTMRDMAIYVSVSAIDKMGLREFKTMRLSLRETKDDGHIDRLYFRPSKEVSGKTNYLIHFDERGTGATISGLKSVYEQIPKLKNILKGLFSDRRLFLKYCKETGLFYCQLKSNFENKIKDLELTPKVPAVYKIMFRGTIQNIGETNDLNRRLKEKEVMEIPIDSVEYSDMSHATDEQRRDCEWELLEAYKKEFYHYPPHNKQGGRKIKN